MSVIFNKHTDENGIFYTATVNSPSGSFYNVDPWTHMEVRVVNQYKRGKNGFGLAFTSKKNQKVLTVGTRGETEHFLREIKSKLNSQSFWSQ